MDIKSVNHSPKQQQKDDIDLKGKLKNKESLRFGSGSTFARTRTNGKPKKYRKRNQSQINPSIRNYNVPNFMEHDLNKSREKSISKIFINIILFVRKYKY